MKRRQTVTQKINWIELKDGYYIKIYNDQTENYIKPKKLQVSIQKEYKQHSLYLLYITFHNSF